MEKLVISSSPHIQSSQHIIKIMRDVLIALLFPLAAGIYYFGINALITVAVSTFSAVLFEFLWNIINKKPQTAGDLSAAVTGMLLGLCLPPTVPFWIPVCGSFFAIIIAKQLYGGLGHNFINPALAGRGFLLASWPLIMTTFVAPFDGVTSATPLALFKAGEQSATLEALFMGNIGGCIGETSAAAILIGALYLVIKRVIPIEGPLVYIASAGLFALLFGGGSGIDGFLFHILSGALLFGAFFMLTDYVTTPSTRPGMIIAAALCGFITALIRVKGGYPEGVTYAILIVNVVSPLLDKYIVPRRYGRKGVSK